jgi:hypothetical protein
MYPPPREIVPVERMDNEIRPYFIHHRNQVGINASLMDLFRLIDLFLKEDEGAREPLRALRIISDYIQRKHIVAPMPSELVNFYDDPHTAAESVATGQNPLAELERLLGPLTGSATYPTSTTRQDQVSHSEPRTSTGLSTGTDEHEPVFHVPLGMPSPSRPSRVDLALAFGDMPVPNLHQGQGLPFRAASTMPATDHRGALFVDVIREKLRSWLHRPDTGALKRWVLKKCQRFQTEDDTWQFVDAYPTDPWAGVAPRAGTQAMEETGSIFTTSFEPIPVTFPHGGIRVTQDTIMHRDSLPFERRRSLSISMARPLPPAPSQGGSHDSSSKSSDPSATSPVGAGRTRNPSTGKLTHVYTDHTLTKLSICSWFWFEYCGVCFHGKCELTTHNFLLGWILYPRDFADLGGTSKDSSRFSTREGYLGAILSYIRYGPAYQIRSLLTIPFLKTHLPRTHRYKLIYRLKSIVLDSSREYSSPDRY